MFPSVCAGDKSALRPSGLRFGSPALTSRGLVQDDFRKVADFIHRGNRILKIFSEIRHQNQSANDSKCFLCSCRYRADPGGTEEPGPQSPSEGVRSGSVTGREVPAASRGDQGRGGGLRWPLPHAWPTGAVEVGSSGSDCWTDG